MNKTKIRIGMAVVAMLAIAVSYYVFGFNFSPCPIELPKSARHARWHEYNSGWLGYELQLKFKAGVRDCLETAEQLIQKHQKQFKNNTNFIYSKVSFDVTRGDEVPRASFDQNNKWWFKPTSIRKGFYIGSGASWNPQIWIDAEKGIFYYKLAD